MEGTRKEALRKSHLSSEVPGERYETGVQGARDRKTTLNKRGELNEHEMVNREGVYRAIEWIGSEIHNAKPLTVSMAILQDTVEMKAEKILNLTGDLTL